VALLRKETCNLRHPIHHRHPVSCYRSIPLFPQKSPIISGSFAEKEVHLKASDVFSPPRIYGFTGHFPKESLIISGSFAERGLQVKASDAFSPLHIITRLYWSFFPQKSCIISGSFVGRDMRCKASDVFPPLRIMTRTISMKSTLNLKSTQKSRIGGSFVERDIQLKASKELSPPVLWHGLSRWILLWTSSRFKRAWFLLQMSFRKRAADYRALLQTMT